RSTDSWSDRPWPQGHARRVTRCGPATRVDAGGLGAPVRIRGRISRSSDLHLDRRSRHCPGGLDQHRPGGAEQSMKRALLLVGVIVIALAVVLAARVAR